MNTRQLIICAIFGISIQGQAIAAPDLDQLKALYPQPNDQIWNYTETVSDDIGLRVERFENGEWKLISFNNESPEAEHLEKYHEYLNDKEEQDDRNEPVKLLPGLLDSLTVLEVLDENEHQVLYRVLPKDLNSDKNDDTHKYLQAELVYSKAENAVISLKMKNTKPFKPQAMIKVIEINIEIRFSDGAGSIPKGFLVEERQDMKGKVMGIKTVEQNTFSTYSEFNRAGANPVEADHGIGNGAGPIPIPTN